MSYPNYHIPFENLSEEAAKYQQPPPVLSKPSLEEFGKNYLKDRLPVTVGEHNIATLIKNNIETMANDILDGDTFYSPFLMNHDFVRAFIRAVSSIPIGYKERLFCNKIVYDYFTSENPDSLLKEQYLSMARIINQDIIHRLVSIGCDDNTAVNLAMARYSSTNEKTNVKRLNFAIYHRDPEFMDEQRVVWIYEKLFNNISDLFQATMFEWYPSQQQNEFGDSFMEVYGTVGLAVLRILNNMRSEDISRVLKGYHNEWRFKGCPPVRFGLRSLSADYSRITKVVEYLHQEGIDIP